MNKRLRILLVLVAVISFAVALSYPVKYYLEGKSTDQTMDHLMELRDAGLAKRGDREARVGTNTAEAGEEGAGDSGSQAESERPEGTAPSDLEAGEQAAAIQPLAAEVPDAEEQNPGQDAQNSADDTQNQEEAQNREEAQPVSGTEQPEAAEGDAEKPASEAQNPADDAAQPEEAQADQSGESDAAQPDQSGESDAAQPEATTLPEATATSQPEEGGMAHAFVAVPSRTKAAATEVPTAQPEVAPQPSQSPELGPTQEPTATPEPTPTPVPTPTPTPAPTVNRFERSGAVPYEQKPKRTLEEDKILPQFQEIYAENPDFAGWITIPGTVIDYPVVQTEDSEYYLHHDFYGNRNANGQIILDTNCDPYTPSYNLVISGHSMKSGKMFGRLVNYMYESYWEDHKLVYFDTLMDERTYVVFGAFFSADYDVDETGFRYNADIQYSVDARQWLREVEENELYDTGIDAEFGDEFLTLTTCNKAHRSDGRFVVVCRRLREGEEIE